MTAAGGKVARCPRIVANGGGATRTCRGMPSPMRDWARDRVTLGLASAIASL